MKYLTILLLLSGSVNAMVPNVIYYYKVMGVISPNSYLMRLDGTNQELMVIMKGTTAPRKDGYFPCEKEAFAKGVEYLVNRLAKASKVEVEHVSQVGSTLYGDVYVDNKDIGAELINIGALIKGTPSDWCTIVFPQ